MPTRAFLLSADQKALEAITQILTELEVSFEIVPDATSGLKRIGTQHFDLILVDCDGGQNAGQLFAAAKTSPLNQGAIAVAITDGKNGVVNAFRLGASLVISKPVSMEQARGTLRNALAVLRKAAPEAKPQPATHTPQASHDGTANQGATSSAPKAASIASISSTKNAQPAAAISATKVSSATTTGMPKLDLHESVPNTKQSETAKPAKGVSVLGEEPLGNHPAPPTFGMSGREKPQRHTSPFVLGVVAMALIAAGIYGYATFNPAFYGILSAQIQRVAVLAHVAPKAQPVSLVPKPAPVAPAVQSPAAAATQAEAPSAPPDGFAEPQPAPAQGFQSNEPSKSPAPVILNTSVPAPKAETEAEPVVVPEDVAETHVSYRVLPTYPEAARRKGVKGSVILNAAIDKDGNVAALEVVSGNSSLASAATAAVKQWRYQVYYHNGQPAEFQTQVTVQFPQPSSR